MSIFVHASRDEDTITVIARCDVDPDLVTNALHAASEEFAGKAIPVESKPVRNGTLEDGHQVQWEGSLTFSRPSGDKIHDIAQFIGEQLRNAGCDDVDVE